MNSRSRIAILIMTLIFLASPAWSQEGGHSEESSYLFQIVLLRGSIEGESDLEGVSANVAEALDDIREFLPYKSYQVVDTQLMRSAGRLEGLLAGPGGQDYRVEMGFAAYPDTGKILVRRFRLGDYGGVHTLVSAGGVSSGQSAPDAGTVKAPRGPRSMIESSFSLDLGETIVVGSSKLNGGGEALLVLLTAIP